MTQTITNEVPAMTMEQVRTINAACCQTLFTKLTRNELIPLPTQWTLEQMLTASRLMSNDKGELTANGQRTVTMHVDPRGLVLHYAFDHFGSSPVEMLRALGFDIDFDSVLMCEGCRTFIARNLVRQLESWELCGTCHGIASESLRNETHAAPAKG
jgi:hypothetical protein